MLCLDVFAADDWLPFTVRGIPQISCEDPGKGDAGPALETTAADGIKSRGSYESDGKGKFNGQQKTGQTAA